MQALKRQTKKQTLVLQSEKEIEQNKEVVAENFEAFAQRISVLPEKSLSASDMNNLLLEQKSVAEEKLIAPVKKELSIEMQKIAGAIDKKEIEQKRKSYQAEIDERIKGLAYRTGEKNSQAQKHEAEIKAYRPYGWAVFGLTFFEVFLCASSFQLLGLSTFLAYLSAGIFGIALHFYVSEMPLKIKAWCNSNMRKELLSFITSLIPLAFIFYQLAVLRKSHAEEIFAMEDIKVHINAGLFVMLNLIASIVALLIVRIYRPERKVYKVYKEYEQQKKVLDKEKKEIQALQVAIDKLPNELDQRLFSRLAYINRGKEVCDSSIAFYQAEFQKAKNNIIARSNGAYMKLFKEVKLPTIENPYNLIEKKETKTHFLIPFIMGLVFLSSCEIGTFTPNSIDKKAVAFCDLSDSLLAHEDFFTITKKEFKQVFMPQDLDGAFEYEQKCITDLRYGEQSQKVTLKAKGNVFETSDRDYRARQSIVAKECVKRLHELKDKERGRNKTFLLYELHRTINALNRSTIKSSRIIACTDWSENSSLNFHDAQTLLALQENVDSIYTLIEKEYPLEQIKKGKKVELILVFRSTGIEQDNRFFIISENLKTLYKQKGIAVHIVKHLNEITWTY